MLVLSRFTTIRDQWLDTYLLLKSPRLPRLTFMIIDSTEKQKEYLSAIPKV